MALIQCPECGQNVSDRAINCPKCGYPLFEERKVVSTVAFVAPEAATESSAVGAGNIDPAVPEAETNRVSAESLLPEGSGAAPEESKADMATVTPSPIGNEGSNAAPATPIPTSSYRMKTDRNAAVILLLSVVTLGIYGIYFMASVVRDVNHVCKEDQQETTGLIKMWLLSLITVGIYGIVWYYKVCGRTNAYYEKHYVESGLALKPNVSGGKFLLWLLPGALLLGAGAIVAMCLFIRNLNNINKIYNQIPANAATPIPKVYMVPVYIFGGLTALMIAGAIVAAVMFSNIFGGEEEYYEAGAYEDVSASSEEMDAVFDAYVLDAYNKFLAYLVETSNDYLVEYYFYDVDSDSTTELIVKTGETEADSYFTFYTHDGSEIVLLDVLSANSAILVEDNGLYLNGGHMGYEWAERVFVEEGYLFTEEIFSRDIGADDYTYVGDPLEAFPFSEIGYTGSGAETADYAAPEDDVNPEETVLNMLIGRWEEAGYSTPEYTPAIEIYEDGTLSFRVNLLVGMSWVDGTFYDYYLSEDGLSCYAGFTVTNCEFSGFSGDNVDLIEVYGDGSTIDVYFYDMEYEEIYYVGETATGSTFY